jgi:hypothetical protein
VAQGIGLKVSWSWLSSAGWDVEVSLYPLSLDSFFCGAGIKYPVCPVVVRTKMDPTCLVANVLCRIDAHKPELLLLALSENHLGFDLIVKFSKISM